MTFKCKYLIKHIRKGCQIAEYHFNNAITTVGLNALLDIMFGSSTQITDWYVGLIDGTGVQTLAAADEMSSHAGWTEMEDYDEATRPQWTPDAAAAGEVSNSTTVDFTINDTNSVHGAFLVDENTKGGATGTLWGTGAFGSEINVINGDVLKITYTINASE